MRTQRQRRETLEDATFEELLAGARATAGRTARRLPVCPFCGVGAFVPIHMAGRVDHRPNGFPVLLVDPVFLPRCTSCDEGLMSGWAAAALDSTIERSFRALPGVAEHARDTDPPSIAAIKARLIRRAGGAVYAPTACVLLGGLDLRALDQRRAHGDVLAVPLGGYPIYPLFQFYEGAILPHLVDVMAAIEGVTPWKMLSILFTPSDELAGATPVDALRAERHEEVMDFARNCGATGRA